MTNETNTKDLFNEVASQLGGKLHFNFKSAGITKEIDLEDLPVETIAILLDYGTRKLNDKVNSLFAMPTNEASRAQLVERVWQEALEGNLGERRSTGSGQAGLRNYILQYIKAQGVPAKAVEHLKGATPQAVINAIYSKKTEEQRVAILAEFTKRYDESLRAMADFDIDF